MKQLCIYFVLCSALLLSVCACSTTGTTIQQHAVNSTVDTISVIRDRVDSVYIKDSIYIHAKGDTIYSERWHTKYRLKYVLRDSIHIRLDSIPYPVEVIKEVKYTPPMTKRLAWIGGISLVILLSMAGIKIYNFFR